MERKEQIRKAIFKVLLLESGLSMFFSPIRDSCSSSFSLYKQDSATLRHVDKEEML
ncbi:hypothetical protein PIB30_054218, partial [Stylosanthes scabra]|nr:hypothetical protein [Stylosanthes scabra]